MDFTNVKDPAGINALLDSLRSSGVFTYDGPTISNGAPTSTSQEAPESTPASEQPASSASSAPTTAAAVDVQQPEQSSSMSSQISSLLSRLNPSASSSSSQLSSSTLPYASSSSSISSSGPAYSPAASTSKPYTTSNPRTMTFQQSLPHIGRLLDDPEILAAIRKMKIEQNQLEQRLWMGRESILAAQKSRVDKMLMTSQLTQCQTPLKERENLRIEFERELERYDRHRVLPAWDTLLTQQQEKLEAMGFPTFFPTTEIADRKKQNRVIDVLSNAIDPEPV